MAAARNSYSVPALDRAIDVVELLAGASEPLTLSAIAGALGLSASAIFRVLRTLEGRGYLVRDAGDGYVLTNRLFEHGLQRPTIASLLEIAFPEMRALALRIRQSCHVSVPSGQRMVTVARVEEPSAPSFVVPIGFTMPMHESASGRVFLALVPPAEQTERLGGLSPAARGALQRVLGRIRKRGYELSPSPGVVGMTDLSFPLFEADARPVAFLAVPLAARHVDRIETASIIAAVRATAERIDAGLARLRRRHADATSSPVTLAAGRVARR